MASEAEELAIQEFLDSLSPENMAILRSIIHEFVNDPEGRLAAYYEGICVSILRVKHNRCTGCGKEVHDSPEALLREHGVTSGPSESADSNSSNVPKSGANSSDPSEKIILTEPGPMNTISIFSLPNPFSSEPLPEVYVDETSELIGQKGLLSHQLLEKMEEYNLDDLRDEDTGAILGFICTKCGMKYGSIADRMLRAPSDCHGCQVKSAWG
jgi:hypothetical protein